MKDWVEFSGSVSTSVGDRKRCFGIIIGAGITV